MISETQAVKLAVAEAKGMESLRQIRWGSNRHGRDKEKRGGVVRRSVDLGCLAWAHMRASAKAPPGEPAWMAPYRAGPLTHVMSRRLAKRVGKKLGQPHRRKDRGPLRAKAAGKNNVRPSRGMR